MKDKKKKKKKFFFILFLLFTYKINYLKLIYYPKSIYNRDYILTLFF